MAGVSLNAIIGDNGIITNAQLANIESKFTGYKEEMEMNIVDSISKGEIEDQKQVTALGESVRKYIPNLKDEDVGLFGIITGKLYYMGNDSLSLRAAKSQGIVGKEENIEQEKFLEEIEEQAVNSIVENLGIDGVEYSNENGSVIKGGIELITKNMENSAKWRIIIETISNEIVKKYQSGYYYVPKDTKIERLGNIHYGYIINYETR